MRIEVTTPEGTVFSGDGAEIIVPTIDGTLGVRRGHQPIIAPLKAGTVIVKQDKDEEQIAVLGGFVEIAADTVRILADAAERSDKLNEAEIAEAIKRAEKLKAESEAGTYQFEAATALLELNLARLKTIRRKHSHGGHLQSPETID